MIGSKSKQPTLNRAGFRRAVTESLDIENHVYEYFVLPETFKKELCNGFEPRWAAKVLIEKGLLKPASDGRPQSNRRLPGLGQKKCYYFPVIDDCEGPEPETM